MVLERYWSAIAGIHVIYHCLVWPNSGSRYTFSRSADELSSTKPNCGNNGQHCDHSAAVGYQKHVQCTAGRTAAVVPVPAVWVRLVLEQNTIVSHLLVFAAILFLEILMLRKNQGHSWTQHAPEALYTDFFTPIAHPIDRIQPRAEGSVEPLSGSGAP